MKSTRTRAHKYTHNHAHTHTHTHTRQARAIAVAVCPGLQLVDNEPVSEEERVQAVARFGPAHNAKRLKEVQHCQTNKKREHPFETRMVTECLPHAAGARTVAYRAASQPKTAAGKRKCLTGSHAGRDNFPERICCLLLCC